MIELHDKHRVQVNRNSSKGNQLKWKREDIWYKADFLGYEALAEYVISRLLEKTNVNDFVKYEIERIEYSGHIYNGCSSKDFLRTNEVLITLPRLFKLYLDEDVYMECERIDWTETDCIKYVVDNVKRITKLEGFGEYLTLVLELDAFFLNEDRHFHNIAVIYNEKTKEFRNCPIFDNGGALFSDTSISFSEEKSIEECHDIIRAKPFSPCFEDQVAAARELYGSQFEFYFTQKDIQEILESVLLRKMYSPQLLERVKHILTGRLKGYML